MKRLDNLSARNVNKNKMESLDKQNKEQAETIAEFETKN